MRFRVTIVALVLAGCGTTNPRVLNANQQCDLAPNMWQQVVTPTFREQLMELPEQISKRPVREHFLATSSEQEVWFEDANHELQACIYNPAKIACYSGELKKVTFMKENTSWVAGPVTKHICHDQSAHNKPLKNDARKNARAS